MKNQQSPNIVAVIDIGSSLIKMRVSQLSGSKIQDLDFLEYPIKIGQEVFEHKKISFESTKKIIGILRGYSRIMQEYGVNDYVVVGGTVLREAKNKAYFMDQIRIHNSMDILVLEDSEKKALIYHEISRSIIEKSGEDPGNTLITFLGSFNIGFALFEQQSVVLTQNITVGSVETSNLLNDLQNQTIDYYHVLDEFLDSNSGQFINDISEYGANTLVISGRSIEFISSLCGVPFSNADNIYSMDAQVLMKLYSSICKLPIQTISDEYSISYDQANTLYSSLAIYTYLLRQTAAKTVKLLDIDVRDVLIRQLLIPKSKSVFARQIGEGSLSCAKFLAARYRCNKAHYKAVLSYACAIFDKMKKPHCLTQRQKLLLKIACVLHECGMFIDTNSHPDATFDIIKNLNIYGLSSAEILETAIISSYGSPTHSSFGDLSSFDLDDNRALYISKLVAILRLANTLDESKKQKIKALKFKIKNNTLICTLSSDSNLYLERWAFNEAKEFFGEVFGIQAKLNIKSLLF